ncbi:MAG: aldo/keto reductase [bacterium]
MKETLIKRPLGRTGLLIFPLGFGAMRLPEKDGRIDIDASVALIRRAIDNGINYIDTAPYYCQGKSEEIIGMAIEGYDRANLIISTKNPEFKDSVKWRDNLERSLEKLKTDYIDVYHFWGIKGRNFRDDIAPPGLYDEALKAKQDVLIRHIAFSFHDLPAEIVPIIDSGLFDVMTVQYSIIDRSFESAISRAGRSGMGVVIMGPLAGGRITQPSPLMDILGRTPDERANLGLRFVLSHPHVSCAISSMSDEGMLNDNIRTVRELAPLTDDEKGRIAKLTDERAKREEIGCTGCNYCLPCPQNVNISFVLQSLEAGITFELWDYARGRIELLRTKPEWGFDMSACNECGECEEKCPQNIVIVEFMRVAKGRLG